MCFWCLFTVCSAVEPVLSKPGPVATVLRELRLWELLRQHTGWHKHTVVATVSRGSWRPLPASSTSAYLGPSSTPTRSSGAGVGVIPGLLPFSPLPSSEGLLPTHSQAFFSEFKQATVTFYFLFVSPTSSSVSSPF